MNKKVLNYIEECEAWKVAIKNLHWSADNMSQHELCDDIASSISDFEDLVSEVEQSISGKIKLNGFTPKSYEIKSLKTFVEDVISSSQGFLKDLEGMGEDYIGIKSECETFIGDMQRKLYLVNFTLKEELKNRLKAKINESMPKNLANHDEVDKFMGRRPKTMKARINQIYRIVKRYGIDSKLYHDDHWQAKDDYYRAITSLGCEFEMRPCGNSNNLDNWDDIISDGGYTDYAEDGMPRSKQYAVKIMYDDGMNIGGYIKFMAAGRVDDPFSAYDTCMILWPKSNRVLENRKINESISAHDIFREVKDEIFNLKNKGEIDLPIIGGGLLDGLTKEEHIVAYFRSEDKITVEYGGEKREIPCDINSQNDDYIARCIMCGFAQIVKGIREGKEIKNQIKLTEAELKQVVKEAAMKVLSETPLNYDIDNFSGRWNKNMPDNDEDWALAMSHASGDYLDDPFSPPNNWDGDDWVDGDKDMETDYSWDLHDYKQDYGSQIDRAISRRNRETNWADKELNHGGRMMDKYVHGKYDGADVGDAWDDLHYESKKPMKVTEQELKQVVKEAAMKLIKEYYTIKSTHGHRKTKQKPKEAKGSFGEREKRLLRQMGKEVDESSDIEIKPENKGKFNATKKATGKSTEELKHSKNPLTRKRATFAANAAKWNKK